GTNVVDARPGAVGVINQAADWAVTVGAPELCGSCTVTLLHHQNDLSNPVTSTVTVYDDVANVALCQISLTLNVNEKTVIRADTCGVTASPQAWEIQPPEMITPGGAAE